VNENGDHAGEGTWAKLRRRKVVQWGIVYAAGAWGFLQGLEYVTDTFHWPERIQQLATLGLLVGLPIALVLAWYHGDRGHQRVSRTELAILTLLFLLGGGIFWRYQDTNPAPAASVTSATTAAKPMTGAEIGNRPSIAVLPFVNMSEDEDNEFFSDGISEELLNVLVRVDGLGVASRTSSFAYKGSQLGTAAIAEALKVNHILEGSVRKAGNRVRITAQLVDAVNDRHLWSETYDRELTDIFAIQEEIANAIVNALRSQLGPVRGAPTVMVRADTQNLEAYELYLKARELFLARRELPESIRLFEQVTQMDPGFARGWEGLAAVSSVAPSWGIRDRDYVALTKQAANRALEIDPSLSMPWAALANASAYSLPVAWAAQLADYDRAIAADARNSTAFLWRGISWLNLGFLERAMADFDRCLAQDPQYQNCTRWKAVVLLLKGQTDAAMQLFERGVEVGFVRNRGFSFVVPIARRGDRVGALLLLKELGASPDVATILLTALEHPGSISPADAATVERSLAEVTQFSGQTMSLAMTRLWMGRYDQIVDAHDFWIDTVLQWDRGFPGFRNSPGFKKVLEKLGLPRYWREHGFPPQCRPVGQQDYTCD
jgi:TolB-like protein